MKPYPGASLNDVASSVASWRIGRGLRVHHQPDPRRVLAAEEGDHELIVAHELPARARHGRRPELELGSGRELDVIAGDWTPDGHCIANAVTHGSSGVSRMWQRDRGIIGEPSQTQRSTG